MKKWLIIITYLFIAMQTELTFSNNINTLQKRLNKISSFQALITYKITTTKNNIIQEGMGNIWIKKPNLFKIHMINPNENILLSDGKILWFYDPIIKQVTVQCLKDVINNTPLILITINNLTYWNNYKIKQQGNKFIITPKYNNNLQKFKIQITSNGIIQSFSIEEKNRQYIYFKLKKQKKILIKNTKFKFKIPKYASLDDQRQ